MGDWEIREIRGKRGSLRAAVGFGLCKIRPELTRGFDTEFTDGHSGKKRAERPGEEIGFQHDPADGDPLVTVARSSRGLWVSRKFSKLRDDLDAMVPGIGESRIAATGSGIELFCVGEGGPKRVPCLIHPSVLLDPGDAEIEAHAKHKRRPIAAAQTDVAVKSAVVVVPNTHLMHVALQCAAGSIAEDS